MESHESSIWPKFIWAPGGAQWAHSLEWKRNDFGGEEQAKQPISDSLVARWLRNIQAETSGRQLKTCLTVLRRMLFWSDVWAIMLVAETAGMGGSTQKAKKKRKAKMDDESLCFLTVLCNLSAASCSWLHVFPAMPGCVLSHCEPVQTPASSYCPSAIRLHQSEKQPLHQETPTPTGKSKPLGEDSSRGQWQERTTWRTWGRRGHVLGEGTQRSAKCQKRKSESRCQQGKLMGRWGGGCCTMGWEAVATLVADAGEEGRQKTS